MIYASVPSSVGNGGNSITRINPMNGVIAGSVYVGSEPNKLAISDSGQTLYVSLDGAFAVRRYDTTTQTPGIQFSIGRGQSVNANDAPYEASDMAVVPGNPDMLAVSRYLPGISPPGVGVALYNNGVMLPLTGPGHNDSANFLAFSSSAATLYGGGYSTGLRTMTVDSSGVTDITGNGTAYSVRKLKFEGNRVFDSNGHVIDPVTRTLLGTCAGVFSDAFAPDTATGRVLYAIKDSSGPGVTIKAFDINTFAPTGTLAIPNVGYDLLVTSLVRYGTNGLAMRTSNNQIYFIQTSLIPTPNPMPTPTGTPENTPTPSPTVYAKFIRHVALPNKDLIYRSSDQKFYVSVPHTADASRANSITRIEPTTATVENSVVVGVDPDRLALSDDDKKLYVGIDGANAIRQLDMLTLIPGTQFPLGTGVNGPKIAYDIDVLPGTQNSLAVSYGNTSSNYDGADIFDDGVKRAQKANASGSINIATADTLYVGENYVYKYGIGPSGLTSQGNFTTGSAGESVLLGNLLYTSGGGVLELGSLGYTGSFAGVGYRPGLTIDVPNNRIFFLATTNAGNPAWSIIAYRLDNFLPVGSVSLPGVSIAVPYPESPHRLIRWGENGLAFNDYSNNVYFVQSDLISMSGTVPTALQLSSQTFSVNESIGTVPVTVIRSGGLAASSTVDYSTVDGTATSGPDYTATSGTLTFAAGETSKTVNIPIFNDNIYEGNETFSVLLSNPSGGTIEIQSPESAVVTIVDDDRQPYVSTSNIAINEPRFGATTAFFTVQLTNPTTQTAMVSYATSDGSAIAGSDYVATSGTLTFAPLETSKTVGVQILADQNYNEPNETFRLNFSNSINTFPISPQYTATIINYNPATAADAPSDFDGDGKTDIAIFRPSDTSAAEWWYSRSSDGETYATQFGISSDKVVAADFTGDGKTDIAFFRPSTGYWYILRSEDSTFYAIPFGTVGDITMPADFDGDGRADPAVFRPSTATWFISKSGGGTTITQFGLPSDLPVAADYDGDGKADIAVFRPNGATGVEWWIQRSTAGLFATQFGAASDRAVPGDYTGDGKTDIAVWRPSTGQWFILRSENLSYYAFQFGATGDMPTPGDYDGDGKTDAAVFRPSNSTWYANRSNAGLLIQQFGQAGDLAVPNEFVR
jgi:hypothetical protein